MYSKFQEIVHSVPMTSTRSKTNWFSVVLNLSKHRRCFQHKLYPNSLWRPKYYNLNVKCGLVDGNDSFRNWFNHKSYNLKTFIYPLLWFSKPNNCPNSVLLSEPFVVPVTAGPLSSRHFTGRWNCCRGDSCLRHVPGPKTNTSTARRPPIMLGGNGPLHRWPCKERL